MTSILNYHLIAYMRANFPALVVTTAVRICIRVRLNYVLMLNSFAVLSVAALNEFYGRIPTPG